MHRRRLAVIALVVLLALPSPAAAGYAGEPELTAGASANTLAPGETTTLAVQISNFGEAHRFKFPEEPPADPETQAQLQRQVQTARNVRATLRPGSAPVSVETATVPLGAIQAKSIRDVPFRVTADETAPAGTYSLKLDLEYEYDERVTNAGVVEDTEEVDETLDVRVRIEEDAAFRIVGVDSTVQVGDTGDVTLRMENVGSATARDATVALQSGNGQIVFGQSASATRYVGAWEPNATREVTFQTTATPDASVQRYALTATVDYDDPDGQPATSDPLSTGITPLDEQSFSLSGNSSLQVGRDGTVSGTVTNQGPRPVDDAVVEFTTQSSTVSVQERAYAVGDLAVGASADFSFAVDVSDAADAGQRQFGYRVTYQDTDGDARRSDPLNSRVDVLERQSRFAVEIVNRTLAAGGSKVATLRVTNRGDEPVRNLQLKAFADDPLSLSDDSAFADELGPGQTTELTVGLSAGGDASPKTYSFSVDFQYDDRTGESKLSETYPVPVEVVQPADDGDSPLTSPLGLGIGLLGLVAVGAVVYRRRTGAGDGQVDERDEEPLGSEAGHGGRVGPADAAGEQSGDATGTGSVTDTDGDDGRA
jgi:hypothetical protein